MKASIITAVSFPLASLYLLAIGHRLDLSGTFLFVYSVAGIFMSGLVIVRAPRLEQSLAHPFGIWKALLIIVVITTIPSWFIGALIVQSPVIGTMLEKIFLMLALLPLLGCIPVLRVVLIGEGPCRQQLEQRVLELFLKDTVIFTGLRKDVAELLPGLDLYVCSSNYEGVSLSILEAMAAEIAVIATAVDRKSVV